MSETTSKIYQHHHANHRGSGFSILKQERGDLLKNIIGHDKSILDLGCRDGALTGFFTKGNQVLGVDVDEVLLGKASINLGISTMKVDLNDGWNTITKNDFDVIVAGEILEHLYFPEEIVKKVVAHLNTRGLFVGSVPNAFSLKNRFRYLLGTKKHTPLEDPTHINHFSFHDLRRLLEKYFVNVEIIGLGRYRWLAKVFPSWFAFDLFFIATK